MLTEESARWPVATSCAIAGLTWQRSLHIAGICRTLLPAQDGLKFIRVARDFHHRAWDDVVRSSDQHPLYAACIALAEPPVAYWSSAELARPRLASRGTARLGGSRPSRRSSPLRLRPSGLFGGCRRRLLRDAHLRPAPHAGRHRSRHARRQPRPVLLRHGRFASARRGRLADRASAPRGSGRGSWPGRWVILVQGRSYWSCRWPSALRWSLPLRRVRCARTIVDRSRSGMVRMADPTRILERGTRLTNLAGLGLSALAIVGCYALVKGEVSEKLAIRSLRRRWAWSRRQTRRDQDRRGDAPRSRRSALGLLAEGRDGSKTDPDFVRLKGSAGKTALRLGLHWGEGLAGFAVPIFFLGVIRSRTIEGSRVGRRLVAGLRERFSFSALVILATRRHSAISRAGTHSTLVVATVPWVGAGTWAWVRGFPRTTAYGMSGRRRPGGWRRVLGLAMAHRRGRDLPGPSDASTTCGGAAWAALGQYGSRST